MVDLWGPGAFGAADAAAVRPSYVPANGGGDPETWYQDCTSPAADDGTEWRSSALNIMLAQMRGLARKAGVAITNLDDLLVARAVRSQWLNFLPAIGGTANALTATLDPAPADWPSIVMMPFRFVVTTANTGAATLNLNGLGARSIVYPGDNSPLLAGELTPGAVRTGLYDGTNVQLIDAGSRARGGVAFRGGAFFAGVSGTGSYGFDPSAYALTPLDRILILCWGAGGGGSSVSGGAGAGGAAGGLAIHSMQCPASSVTVTTGAGGALNNAGSNGGNGGTSSFGAHCSATGGTGGSSGSTGGGGGIGGSVANLSGGSGGDIINSNQDWSPGGAAPLMGNGLISASFNPIGAGGAAGIAGAYDGAPGAVLVIF